MDGLLNSLAESELALVRETDRERIAGLDEDALMDLHTRIRRARNKYVKLYRREAAPRVAAVGGRGAARPKNQRNAQKSEVFEDALARVSRQLAAAARRSASELRAQRLTAVRRERIQGTAARRRPATAARATGQRATGQRATARTTAIRTTARATAQQSDRRPTSPAARKRQASTLATGARRQARRDAR
jgi:hypothetical protein